MRRLRLTIAARAGLLSAVLVALALASQSHPLALAAVDCASTGSPAGPYAFDTWEAGDYKARYAHTSELAATNQLFPENPSFALPSLETGDRASGSSTKTAPYIPPVILKAIAYIESGWAQGSYDPLVKYGETGPVLISADCGYGVMQVTSGMQNVSGIPTVDQVMIGGSYAYNIARGAQILAAKWNDAPELRPIVGNRDPQIIENWYYALWGYNGFAFRNHPLNSGYNPDRPWFDCRDGSPRDYPYQELIFGCIANPPLRDGLPLWDPVPVVLPDLQFPQYAGPFDTNNWNPCSFSADCAAMDIPTMGGDGHPDPTTPSVTREALLGQPAVAGTPVAGTVEAGSQTQANVAVTNPGTGLASWRALGSTPWLKTSLQGISMGADIGDHVTPLTLRIDATSLTPGDYSASVAIESAGSAGAPLSIPVSVHVSPPPNCNGSLDASDALAVFAQLSGVGGCLADVPDMNCDGAVDAVDATLVLRYLAGAGSGPPQCG
jgi:hypothetical protein